MNHEALKIFTDNNYSILTGLRFTRITVLYKSRGDRFSVIVLIDNPDKLAASKNDIEEIMELVKENVGIYLKMPKDYLVVSCDDRTLNKKVTKAPNTCALTTTGELACSKNIDSHLSEDVAVLKNFVEFRKYRIQKANAFADDFKEHTVIVTIALAIILCGMYIAYMLKGVDYLGNVNALGISVDTVIKGKEWFRLTTYMFAHSGLIHLIYNVISLVSFGKMLEERIGWLKFTILYLYGGIFAGVISCYLKSRAGDMTSITVGASGAIYAVAGAVFVYSIMYAVKYKDSVGPIIIYEVVLIGSGFLLQNVDMYAHLGGWFMGVTMGIAYILFDKVKQLILYNQAVKKVGNTKII